MAEALESERSQFCGLEFSCHIRIDAFVDEYLSRFGFVAEARGEIGDIADRGIIEAPVEADAAEGGRADRDADPEAEPMAALPPNFRQIIDSAAHVDGEPHRAFDVVGYAVITASEAI